MTAEGPVAVLGAGGHACVVLSALRAAGVPVDAVYDDDPAREGEELLGVRIRTPIPRGTGAPAGAAILAIGANRARRDLADQLPGTPWAAVVHPAAWIDPSVSLGPGAVVMAGAIVQPRSRIGAHAVVNTGARIDHDCVVEAFAHVAPGATLAGNVQVGEGAFIGAAATVIPGVRIGAWAIVGAGAAVVRDVEEYVTVAGVPARVLKRGAE